MLFIDGHCDTITTVMRKEECFYKNNCHIDIERLKKFDSPIQVFSVWLEREKLSNPFFYSMEAINFFKKQVLLNRAYISLGENYYDLCKNMKNRKISGILGLEGCEAFEGNIENIYKFFDSGVRIFTITWNYENELGFGAATESSEGLKPFGKKAVKILNDLGGIIDVSHLNEKGFYDICEISEKPFIASHSNSKEICNHLRNLTDMQIKEISQREGIIGINLYPYFLENDKTADMNSVIRHIEHIMNVGGENILGFGCDFDGIDKMPDGIKSISDMDKLFYEIKRCFGEKIAEKIIGKNFLRFFKKNLKKYSQST